MSIKTVDDKDRRIHDLEFENSQLRKLIENQKDDNEVLAAENDFLKRDLGRIKAEKYELKKKYEKSEEEYNRIKNLYEKDAEYYKRSRDNVLSQIEKLSKNLKDTEENYVNHSSIFFKS